MNFTEKLYCSVLLSFIIAGCATVPTAEHPAQLKRTFHKPFDEVWDCVLGTVESSQGIIITKDKSRGTGVIVCASGPKSRPKVYMNIYLKEQGNGKATSVYLTPHLRYGRIVGEVDKIFFDVLEKSLEED